MKDSITGLQLPDDFTNEGYQENSASQNNIERTSIIQPSLGAGLLYYASWGRNIKNSLYTGLAVSHLNSPNKSSIEGNSNPKSIKLTFHAGVEKRFNSKWGLSPRIVLLHQNPHIESNLGLKLNTTLEEEEKRRM
jgi:hypothetical protein